MRPFRQEKRRLPKSITRLEKKRNYAKKIWHSPPRSGYLGTPLPLPQSLYGGGGVQAYRRTGVQANTDVTTKIFRIDRLPDLLSNSDPLAR